MYQTVGVNHGGRPHIRFETRSEEDRTATLEAGHKVYKDRDWVIITPHGARDCVENHAEQWLTNISNRAEAGQYDIEWVNIFRKMYALYKEGKEMPVEGTPLRMLAHLFTPAEIANCANVNIQTLEQLSVANEETLARLGMGAREWKNRATEALKLSEGKGDALRVAALETENNDLKTRVSDLENVIRDLQIKMGEETSRRGPGRPPKEA